MYCLEGNRIINLMNLKSYINIISEHSITCGNKVELLGEKMREGLASTLVSYCTKCEERFLLASTPKVSIGGSKSSMYDVNVGAVLSQISTGGGGAQLDEQMSAMRTQTFTVLERKLGGLFEEVVTSELLAAGEEEKRIAIEKGDHEDILSITVIVDGGWSKRSHKHSYNANSGVGVIFGLATQRLLFIGVRNKYCSICSIADRKGECVREHNCIKNWAGSSTAMESDIIVEGFNLSESMHGLRYMQFIEDGDSSVHYNIVTSVPYGRHVEKIECANHAVKCYHTRLANIVKDNPSFGGSGNLTKDIITKITQAARKAITAHSCTGDVEALRNDLHNGPKHYFGDHSNGNSTICSKKVRPPLHQLI